VTDEKILFAIGDLVYYTGPPVLSPLDWHLIIDNDNGIISKEHIGIIITLDLFLNIANVFFQHNKITLQRVSCKDLKHVQ